MIQVKEEQKRRLALLAAVMLILSAGCANTEKFVEESSQSGSSSAQQALSSQTEEIPENQGPSREEPTEAPSQQSSEASETGEQADELAAQAKELLALIEQGESAMEIAPELPFSSQRGTEHLERVDQWMAAVAAGEKDAFVGKLMGSVSPEIYTLEYDGDMVTMTVYLPIPGQQPRQEQGMEIWQAPDFYLIRGTETIFTIPKVPQPSQQYEKEVSGEPALSSQQAQERGMELYGRLQNSDVTRGVYGIFLPKAEPQETAVVQQQEIVMVEDIPAWKLTVSNSQEGGNTITFCLGGEQGEKVWEVEQVNGMLVPLGLEEECTLLYQAD